MACYAEDNSAQTLAKVAHQLPYAIELKATAGSITSVNDLVVRSLALSPQTQTGQSTTFSIQLENGYENTIKVTFLDSVNDSLEHGTRKVTALYDDDRSVPLQEGDVTVSASELELAPQGKAVVKGNIAWSNIQTLYVTVNVQALRSCTG